MYFNSIDFAIFLPIVFLLYWFASKESLKIQNVILLVAGYFFYSCWDYRFLGLLIFSTMLDFVSGIQINKAVNQNSKRWWLWLSIAANLGFLGLFKYYNFFVDSFVQALLILGIKADYSSISFILPVGISFYTFHGLSYIIDVFKERIKPERNIVNYALFVSFFPLLVAGPIERATHLLPQIIKKRKFDYSKSVIGLRQILWGLFKKIAIADNCAEYVNSIFNNHANFSGSTLAVGAIFFSIQIYADFSGYSDIAIGTARLFGIDLLRNFAFPYFSRSIAEFWRRWHISLTSWFRDYLYIPLGGNKYGLLKKSRNVLIVFFVSGLWHGANFTFIVWGLINALFILPSVLFKSGSTLKDDVIENKILPSLIEVWDITRTFTLITFAWIFFRAENLQQAFDYISGIFSNSFWSFPTFPGISSAMPLVCLICLFILVEWIGRKNQFAIEYLGKKTNGSMRWVFYYIIILTIVYFAGNNQQFIYFQF